MTIVTKRDVNNGYHQYTNAFSSHLKAVAHLKILNHELKNVKQRANNKGYQSYKAVTTKLRREQQETIQRLYQERHLKYRHWHTLRYLEWKQNKESNKQEVLQEAIKKLNHEEMEILKEYLKREGV